MARRAAREPLQHLTGAAAFRHVELQVGPGVFVPRPETELLAGWAIERALEPRDGAGRGRPVLRLRRDRRERGRRGPAAPGARRRAGPGRARWAERNLAGTGVDLRLGDMADAFADLDGTVDVVVCNPPYIPLEAWASVAPEARDHDPAPGAVVRGGRAGRACGVLESTAARLLRPGGWVGAEHADVQGESAARVFAASGRWREVRDHPDLAGRARYLTARLAR